MRTKMIQKLQCLFREMNLLEHKETIYASYGVTSCKEMSDKQLVHLISALEEDKRKSDPARKKLISDCLTVITSSRWMGFPNSWKEINALVRIEAIGKGKILAQMSVEELIACHKRLVMAHTNGFRYKAVSRKSVKKTEGVKRRSQQVLLVDTSQIKGGVN